MRRLLAGAALCGLVGLVWQGGDVAGAAGRTTKDGVYSEAQAARGQATYVEMCSGCHGLDLEGAPFVAPPLKGSPFIESWRDDSVGALFQKIREDMPKGDTTRVTEVGKLDVLAYLLKANELPAGSADLAPDVLATTVVDSPLPRVPVDDSALVRVIGCLGKAGGQFTLARATSPVRSREGLPSTPLQLQAASEMPLGSGTYKVMDALPAPDAHIGKRVDVKGILMLRPEGNAVNVTALQPTGASCTP